MRMRGTKVEVWSWLCVVALAVGCGDDGDDGAGDTGDESGPSDADADGASAEGEPGESDVPDVVLDTMSPGREEIGAAVATLRENYVRECLAREFPRVLCARGSHLRID